MRKFNYEIALQGNDYSQFMLSILTVSFSDHASDNLYV